MSYPVDFTVATSEQIETALCKRLESIRLSRNMTQRQLAEEAGVSLRTVGRLEKGQGVSLDTFIRVLMALRVQHGLEGVLPDPSVRPIERIGIVARARQRARPAAAVNGADQRWSWADGEDGRES